MSARPLQVGDTVEFVVSRMVGTITAGDAAGLVVKADDGFRYDVQPDEVRRLIAAPAESTPSDSATIPNPAGSVCHDGPSVLCGNRHGAVVPNLPYGTFVCTLAADHVGPHVARSYSPTIDWNTWSSVEPQGERMAYAEQPTRPERCTSGFQGIRCDLPVHEGLHANAEDGYVWNDHGVLVERPIWDDERHVWVTEYMPDGEPADLGEDDGVEQPTVAGQEVWNSRGQRGVTTEVPIHGRISVQWIGSDGTYPTVEDVDGLTMSAPTEPALVQLDRDEAAARVLDAAMAYEAAHEPVLAAAALGVDDIAAEDAARHETAAALRAAAREYRESIGGVA